MKNNYRYPYQNLDLTDMAGEQWEDVPGFDGAYQVSNYGRIKSLKRWKNAGKGGGYYTKEIIRKLSPTISPNNYIGTPTYHIGINVKQDGESASFPVAKLVYYCFVRPFDLNDPNIIISSKDLDGRNLASNNLILTNRSEVRERTFREERTVSHFEEYKVPVLQFDMKGKIIGRYCSLEEAKKCKGYSVSAISACTKGRIFQHKEHIWRRADQIDSPLKVEKEQNILNLYLWEKLGKPVTSVKHPIVVVNLCVETLAGEMWKPIEGLEGSYEISNMGRVKSIARFKGNLVWLKEHIQKLIPDGKGNHPPSSLLVCLSKEGKKYQQSVARLVYYHWVDKFDLADMTRKIGYKDKCFYNLTSNNLNLKDKPTLSKVIIPSKDLF